MGRQFSGRYPRTEQPDTSDKADLSDPQAWKRWRESREAAQDVAESSDRYREGVIEYRPAGREIVICRDPNDGHDPGRGGGIRGDVHGFSRKSRRNLMQVFSRLERDHVPLFVTLTYHETDPDPETAKTQMDTFAKAVGRKFDGSRWSYIWRMEFQERGAIHFHLLFYGASWIPKRWLKSTWHRITGERTREHRQMGAWVEYIRHPRKVTSYISKYMAKTSDQGRVCEDGEPWTGRMWGIRNRKWLPVAEAERIRIRWETAYALVSQLLDEWGSDIDVVPYRLHICTESPIEWIKERLKPYEKRRSETKSRD